MSILGRLFGRKDRAEDEHKGDSEITIHGHPFIDMRGDKERQIEREANAGKGLGAEADLLVAELIQIGNGLGYISSKSGGEFNQKGDHIRTREIGERLNEIGGNDLMIAANYKIRAALGGGKARELEYPWDGIGDWRH